MKNVLIYATILSIINCQEIGVFLEKTPTGQNQQDYYLHLHFKDQITQAYKDRVLIYKMPYVFEQLQNNNKKQIVNIEEKVIRLRICYKDDYTVKCFKETNVDFTFNGTSQKIKHEVELKRKKICAFGTLTQYSQYFYKKALYGQSIEAYMKNIEVLSAPQFQKQMLKFIMQEMENVFLGYNEQINYRHQYYRDNLCKVNFQKESLQISEFTGRIQHNFDRNNDVLNIYLFIKKPQKKITQKIQFIHQRMNQRPQESQKLQDYNNNLLQQQKLNINAELNKKIQKIKLQFQVRSNKKNLQVEPQSNTAFQNQYTGINTLNINNLCQKNQNLQLLVMHCNIFAPSENNIISEDVFSTDECKLLKNKQNFDQIQICQQKSFITEYYVIEEIINVQQNNNSFQIVQDNLLETCDYIIDEFNSQLIIRCYNQTKLKIKTKLGFSKEFNIHKNFKPLENQFILQNYVNQRKNKDNKYLRRILRIKSIDVFYLLFLAFIIGVLIAILAGAALTGVYFVLLIIVTVLMCLYFFYRLGQILDKNNRRVLEGIMETRMQMKGKELYEKMTPEQKLLIYDEITILQKLTQQLMKPLHKNQKLLNYGQLSYSELQLQLQNMYNKHQLVFGNQSQQNNLIEQRNQVHQNKIGNMNQQLIESQLQETQKELSKIQDEIKLTII